MKIKLIACTDSKGGIGKNGSLPWPHFGDDMRRFKALTENQIVVMGRKTFESLPDDARPLKDRLNIILSGTIENISGVLVEREVGQILNLQKIFVDDIWIIGGQSIYEQFIDLADEIYLTRIQKNYECDRFFPKIEKNAWYEPEVDVRYSKELGAEYSFMRYVRRK